MLDKTTSRTLTEKWNPILEGINDQNVRESTAVLLENQARSIITEYAKDSGTSLNESTNVGSLGTFQKFAFPLVRRVFPELIANKIAGVQPMQGPVSQIFYLGNSRVGDNGAGAQVAETVYSKYNLTYAGLTAGANTPNGFSGSTEPSTVAHLTSGTLDASATMGGQIADFPGSGNIGGFNVNAGEALTGSAIPEINFHIEQQAVVAKTRKFRAMWTLEAAQDLRAYHNLDLERELTDLLGKEVSLEIDRELVEDLRNIAYGRGEVGGYSKSALDLANANSFANQNGTGTPKGGAFAPGGFNYAISGATAGLIGANDDGGKSDAALVGQNVYLVDFATTALSLNPRHVGQVYANLVATLNFAAQDIYKTTFRGAGNWIVTSPMMAAVLQSASQMEGGVRQGEMNGTLGRKIEYRGKMLGAYDVYVDPMYPDDEIMMGYKGSSPMDAGYIYCPYIPLQMLPTITSPEDFQPRKGLLTRYAKAAITPESRFYRIIRVVGVGASFLTAGATRQVLS
jgi:hypothetical protein